MAAVKSLNTNYIITNKITPSANITLATNTVFVQGNLVVGGNATAITKTDLNITDNIITVNSGETGAGVTLVTAGIAVDRGSLANVSIVWNETLKAWTLTNDGTTFNTIQTASGTAVTSAQVYALVL
jgi:hypothetical protein